MLLSCPQPHLHALRVQRHNKAIWEIRKLLLSSNNSRCYTLMNARTFNNMPPKNIVPPWLLPCTCNNFRCHSNARFRHDILCVCGIHYLDEPPIQPTPHIIIQFIEFTYTNDRILHEKILEKIEKYAPLLEDIRNRGWNAPDLIVIIAGARSTTHKPSIQKIKETFQIPKNTITNALININTIAIYHLTSIILHKRRLENNQPLPIPYDPP